MRKCMKCMNDYSERFDICPHCGDEFDSKALMPYHLDPSTILMNRYIIGKAVGYGGFGITYIAWDFVLERKVAIKEYLPLEFSIRVPNNKQITVFKDEKHEQFTAGIEKFKEEAEKLMKFQSVRGIVKLYNLFEENGTAYIVMEYLEGENLQEKLKKDGKMPIHQAVEIIRPILEALSQVHKSGIIHRDIAPDNIFLTKDGQVKLIDFGASRFATTKHSRSLSVLIKSGFSPAEQYRSTGDQGSWTDVYAVAATIYYMISGVVPQDAMKRQVKDRLKRPSRAGAVITREDRYVENAIMNALNRETNERTQDCELFLKELDDVKTKWNKIPQIIEDIGKWPIWLKLSSSAVSVSVVLFIALLLTGVIKFNFITSIKTMWGAGIVEVPEVIGRSKKVAEEKLSENGLHVQYVDYIEDETIAKDCVYKQEPGVNERIEKGETVYLVLSCGEEIKYMMDAVGYYQEDICHKLEEMGMLVQLVEEFGAGAPGTVLRQMENGQDIGTGTQLKNGMAITIVISKGIEGLDPSVMTTVPELSGQDFVTARNTAGTAGLYVRKIKEEFSETIPSGNVVAQQLAAGTAAGCGTVLELVVSKGDTVEIPDFSYKLKRDVETSAAQRGIQIEFIYKENDTIAKDHVISQSIQGGSKAKFNEKLIVYVSEGNKNSESYEDYLKNSKKSSTTRKAATEAPKTQPENISEPQIQEKEQQSSDTKPNKKPEVTQPPITQKPVVKNEEVKITVPSVCGITQTDAMYKLSEALLNVKVSYEFNNVVTMDQVISQSPVENASVTQGTTVSIVISKGSKAPNGWTNDGSFINNKYYSYMTKTQYLQQTRTAKEETTTSGSSSMNGWTLYNVNSSWGEYGGWSGWSGGIAPSSSDTTQYQQDHGFRVHYYCCPVHRNQNLPNANMVSSACGDAATERVMAEFWDADGNSYQKGTYRFLSGLVYDYYIFNGTNGWWYHPEDIYRYRARSRNKNYTYSFKRTVYGSWGNGTWVDRKPSESDTCQIAQTKTLYYYREK